MKPICWWHGWLPLIVLPGLVTAFVPSDWPRWALMWLLAFAIYCGCKWLTWRRTPVSNVPVWKHIAYLTAWPGLDAKTFLTAPQNPSLTRRANNEWLFALGKLALGLLLLFGLARLLRGEESLAAGWVGMIGIVMALHFGLFHLLSCSWRYLGVEARPLMNWPAASESVAEFWGRRWNLAFRDLTYRFLFRPCSARLGPKMALLVGFGFSGLMHDLVISVPAQGGYGGPSLFFLVQGSAIFVERSVLGRRLGLGHGWRGWLFSMGVLIVPVGMLFHPQFIMRIVLPFMHALRAL